MGYSSRGCKESDNTEYKIINIIENKAVKINRRTNILIIIYKPDAISFKISSYFWNLISNFKITKNEYLRKIRM